MTNIRSISRTTLAHPPSPVNSLHPQGGKLEASCDPAQVPFGLHAIGMAANWHHQLFGGPTACHPARTAWIDALERLRRRIRKQT